MALSNPIEAFLQVAQAKERNRQQAMQDALGISQNVAGMADQIKKQLLQKRLSQMMGQANAPQMPMQGPSLPGVGLTPTAKPPVSGMGAPTPPFNGVNRGELMSVMGQLYPEVMSGYMSQQFDPLKQSEIAKNLAQAKKYEQGGMSGKPVSTIYRNSVTGDLTDDSTVAVGKEWKEYKTTQGDVLNKLVSAQQSKAKNDALMGRAEAWQRSIDVRQINELAKNVGLTQKQQSALQANNLRADRAIQVLSKPTLTWQELSLGEIDLAGIMQGGVPHVDEVKNTHFPGWQEQWARWQTYANGHPTENVPDPIRKKVLGLVRDVIEIDNRFIHANSVFRQKMVGPTVRGGIGQFQPAVDEMTNVLTTQPGAQSQNSDPLGIR